MKRRTKNDIPSQWLSYILLPFACWLLFMQVRTVYQYHQLNNGVFNTTNAWVTRDDRINDGTDKVAYSYKFSYQYEVNHKAYTKNETFLESGLHDKHLTQVAVRYLPTTPSVANLDLSGLKLSPDHYSSNKQVGSWVLSYVAYFCILFLLLNLLIGYGKLPRSWVWGNKVEHFGLIAALACIIGALVLSAPTLILINAQ